MTLSDALAGFAGSITSRGDVPENPNTPHYHFIHSTLIPLTGKLQKELRGRKFKEVQNKLQEASNEMQTFQFEKWPPPSAEQQPQQQQSQTTPSPSSAKAPPRKQLSLDDHFMSQPQNGDEDNTTVDTEAESTMGDFSKAPEEEEEALETFDEVAAEQPSSSSSTDSSNKPPDTVSASTPLTTMVTAQTAVTADGGEALLIEEDDPQTREKMHDSITHVTEAYVLIMLHPSKTNKACEIVLDCISQLVDANYISGRAGGRDDQSGSGAAAVKAKLNQDDAARSNGGGGSNDALPPSLMHQLMTGIQKCSESNTESVQAQVVKAFKSIMTSPKCGVHEASMLMAVRSIFHIYLVTKSKTVQDSAKEASMEMVATIVRRAEQRNALYHTDSYYLLRSLCKLSSKSLPGIDDKSTTAGNFLAQQFLSSTTTVDPLALNNKVLSLELLLQIMDCAGNVICNGEKFVHLVQSNLCVSLLKNCMSNNTQVAFLSQKVFLILVYKFKAHLKDEIQVFMSNIFLRVMDSENSSYAQKALVLESLRSLCSDPLLLTTIFLHYDCDFDAMNLYKDIVFRLTKVSGKFTATSANNKKTKSAKDVEEQELSLAAVEVLVTILQAFLKALGITSPGDDSNDTAGKKIRKTLEIENVGFHRRRQSIALSMETVSANSSLHDSSIQSMDMSFNLQSIKDGGAVGGPAQLNEILLQHQLSSSADVAGQIVDAFDRKRNAEQNFELGAVKFTLSIKSGLNFFIDNGFTTLNAKDIAEFFLAYKDKLDKTQMGEVLGKEPDSAFLKVPTDPDKGGQGFYVRILHYYVEALDFTGLMFDDAIRLFLSGFRLPGEAQKIDRIMEKFAQRFTKQNADVFHSADTAFILAFSVIMLNTDLHNPSIKEERRMTLDSFIRNNRGIGENGSDLPEEFLSGIFQRIKKSPFSLKEDDAAREKKAAEEGNEASLNIFGDNGGYLGAGIFGTSSEDRKKEKFKKEREEMMSATEQLIRRRKGKAAVSSGRAIDGVAPADVVKPMFEVTWGPIIGILSQVLEFSNDSQSIDVCLNGFVYAIRIASYCDMSLARDTFINSLAKLTLLGSVKEIKQKNIEAIRTMMSLAISDGEYLGESWGPVLQCISQLARMRMSASGLHADESFLQEQNSGPSNKRSTKTTETVEETIQRNAKAVHDSVGEELIDSVFSSTTKLSAHSLAHFIEQLVAVSSSEVEGESKQGITGVAFDPSNRMNGSSHGEDGPSIFSLHRLVEVADFNMDVRPRLVWAQVWEIMAEYFAVIGCHRNSVVSVFAIDSLRQLSSKFLEKPELSEFNFQRLFLRPFLFIMENPETRPDTRELILECISQLINTRGHNLRSGWKIFFDILVVAAKDPSDKLTHLGLNILQRLLDKHLDSLCHQSAGKAAGDSVEGDDTVSLEDKKDRDSNAEDFIGMCRASLAYVQLDDSGGSPAPIGLSLRALCHTAIYADLIGSGRVLPPHSGAQHSDPYSPGYTYSNLSDKEALEMVLWRPMLEGLALIMKATVSSRDGGVGCLVQRGSVLAVRSILLRHGNLFSPNQLEAVLKDTLIPAINQAAQSDHTAVATITSESPAVSNLDFLVEPLPLPPPRYDRGLLKFEEVARSADCAPKRPLGPAELLLEASFTDMRHAGDGDLTQAYKFAQKEMNVKSDDEQPFPDSWIGTTAPVALGCLTDIATEVAVTLDGLDGSQKVWPQIGSLIRTWCNGGKDFTTCEALVRISCCEVNRFAARLNERLPRLERKDAILWSNSFATYYSELLAEALDIESRVRTRLLNDKLAAYRLSNAEETESGIQQYEKIDIHTPYGRGLVVDRRVDDYDEDGEVTVDVVSMNYGTLYFANGRNVDDGLPDADALTWVKLVPVLKTRCIAAHLLHRAFIGIGFEGLLVPLLAQNVASDLLNTLNRSREFSDDAVENDDIAHAFQEATYSEWGLEEDLGEEALVNVAKLSQTRGSSMFFLTQSSGATNASIQILTALYEFEGESGAGVEWDKTKFAAPYLLDLMKDVLVKFIESEARERHRIDPNVWRNAAESGIKIAVYCTSFASVVVVLLKAMLAFDQSHIERNKQDFFTTVCRLIRVQNDEIRQLVQRILMEKFAPLLGVENGH